MNNEFFKNVEKKTGVNMKEVLDLANSLQGANFKDADTVRKVIQRVSRIAKKDVPKELEDKIVQSIIKEGKQLDFNTISKMINKKVKRSSEYVEDTKEAYQWASFFVNWIKNPLQWKFHFIGAKNLEGYAFFPRRLCGTEINSCSFARVIAT